MSPRDSKCPPLGLDPPHSDIFAYRNVSQENSTVPKSENFSFALQNLITKNTYLCKRSSSSSRFLHWQTRAMATAGLIGGCRLTL